MKEYTSFTEWFVSNEFDWDSTWGVAGDVSWGKATPDTYVISFRWVNRSKKAWESKTLELLNPQAGHPTGSGGKGPGGHRARVRG